MQAKSTLMMRVLMNRYHQGAPGPFLKGLSEEDAQAVINHTVSTQEVSRAVLDPVNVIATKIHYTWIIPIIETFDPEMQTLFIACLPKPSSANVRSIMGKPIMPQPAPPVQQFLLGLLCKKLNFSAVLPVPYLPQTALTPLGEYTKQQLVELIEFLGLFDLSQEIRHIVDKTILQGIYNSLSKKQQHFLRVCLHQKEKVTASKMGLKNWKGDSDQLHRVLHRRGLIRLGYALSGQHPDLIWHIVHRMDVGRGHLLTKYCGKKEISGVTFLLTQQVLSVINFFKR